MLYPAHLVFHYERLMSLAFAQCERPVTALLLGVGGAAMWRSCAPMCRNRPTLVDNDEGVVAMAKRWFYLTQPVMLDSAERFLAATTTKYDVILVDLYNSHGPAEFDCAFWTRCLDALAPGGCLATNWADFASNAKVRRWRTPRLSGACPRPRLFLCHAARLPGIVVEVILNANTAIGWRHSDRLRCSRTVLPARPADDSVSRCRGLLGNCVVRGNLRATPHGQLPPISRPCLSDVLH